MKPPPVAFGLGVLLLAVFLASAAGLGESSGESSREDPTPAVGFAAGADVVLVTVDTLRADVLSFGGAGLAKTPTLDRLAAAGRVFVNAYAHNVVTLPSHANILTGLYPYEHGVRDNSGFRLPPRIPTLATRLAAAGYATGAFVGAFPLDSRYGLDRGFDRYDDRYPDGSRPDEFRFAERPGHEVVAAARAWWDSEKDGPRFLWVHLYDPHAPYAPPEPFASSFAGRPYLGEIAATDAFLEPLLAPLLDRAKDARPALVVFTADHGEAMGDHGEMTHGLFAYQPTLRAPLVIAGEGVPPGVDSRLAGHVDVAPTILWALGLEPETPLSGYSLFAPEPSRGRLLYFEALSTTLNRGWAPLRGVIEGDRKAVDLPLPELYDLAADPKERRNLAASDPEGLAALLAKLPDATGPGGEVGWVEQRTVPAAEREELEALGYLVGEAERPASFTADDDPKRLVGLDRKLHLAVDAYSRGELTTAESLAREVVATRPRMAVGWELLAAILRRGELPREALEVLEEAKKRGLGSPALTRQLGLTLAETGQAEAAVELLEPLADDDDPAALTALGIALTDAGRHREAIRILERTLAIDPDDARAAETLGVVYLRLRRPTEAVAQLDRALAINGSLPVSWNSLGVARSWLGDDRAAIAAWERAVELDPQQFDALYNLGVTAARIGERETARRALERFIATAPRRFVDDIAAARRLLEGLGS